MRTKALLFLFVCLILPSLVSAQAFTVKGRAYGVWVNNVPGQPTSNTYICDSGPLPPTGGNLAVAETNYTMTGVLDAAAIAASSSGDDCGGDSSIQLTNAVFLPGHAAEITVGFLSDDDDDTCCQLPGEDMPATIQDLTVGGAPVAVTGQLNQIVPVPGSGTLVINERITLSSSDCDEDDVEGNALHMYFNNGGELIVGNTYFHSDDQCCFVPVEFSTWGAIKSLYR